MNDGLATAPIQRIDGAWLRQALIAGIYRVISHRDYINKINVFPVADSDTGTNLAFTLNAVLTGATRRVNENVGEFLVQVADHALDGSRGNSGAIFAQYLQGLSEQVENRAELTPAQFANAALAGARSARGAIAKPREGTMLSVIRDHARELQQQIGEGVEDFRALLERALERARQSLADTPKQLEVLRQNGVVDAGAQGFVDLLEGIQEFIERGSLDDLVPDSFVFDESEAPEQLHTGMERPEHRFCTECVISGEGIDRDTLRDRLEQLDCSSLVIAGTRRKARVHLHVDNPAKAFVTCESFGLVSSQKADDMWQQQRSSHAQRHPVAVLADTGADLPESETERLNIHLVPLRVNFGERQYLDKISLSPDEFYAMVRSESEAPKTSQPPPGDFRRQFEFLGSHSEAVVCVNVSSALSGTWQAAESARKRVHFEHALAWDSLNASCGQGLLTLYAAEAAEAGMGLEQVVKVLDAMRPRTRTFAVLRDLSYGVRGGRIPAWLKRVADLLRLTAVIGNNSVGLVKPMGALLATGNLAQRFARWIVRRMDRQRTWRLIIGHCDAPEEARVLRDALVAQLPRVQAVYITDVGTAIGAHAGPGSLVVGIQDYQAPDEMLEELAGGAQDA